MSKIWSAKPNRFGWIVLAVYAAVMIKVFIDIDSRSHSVSDTLIAFVPRLAIMTVFLMLITRRAVAERRPFWTK